MTNQRTDTGFFRIMLLCTVIAMMVIMAALSGCKSEKHLSRKTIAKMDKVEAKYLEKSEKDTAAIYWAATRHPVKVAKGKTVVLRGKHDTTTLHDTTLTVHRDTVVKTVTVTKRIHSVDTVYTRDTLVDDRENKLLQARNKGLELEASAAKEGERKAIESKNKWVKRAAWLAGLSLLLILLIMAWVLRGRK